MVKQLPRSANQASRDILTPTPSLKFHISNVSMELIKCGEYFPNSRGRTGASLHGLVHISLG